MPAPSPHQPPEPTEPAEPAELTEGSASPRDILATVLALACGALVTLAWVLGLVLLGRLMISGLF